MSGPRRRIVVKVEIGSDDWRNVQFALRTLADDIDRKEKLSGSIVSGSPSVGWIVTADEDPTITHDSYFAAVDQHLKASS